MNPTIYIFIIIAGLIIRFIISVAKKNSANQPPPNRPNLHNNQSFKQPPPYNRSAQQPTTDFTNLFKEQKSGFESKTNQFTNTASDTPSFKDPFDEGQDAFSNIPSHNTHSNMGAGSQSYYCMYCGKKFQSTATLKMDTCFKHPKSDQGLQKHVLYTGAGKPNIGF